MSGSCIRNEGKSLRRTKCPHMLLTEINQQTNWFISSNMTQKDSRLNCTSSVSLPAVASCFVFVVVKNKLRAADTKNTLRVVKGRRGLLLNAKRMYQNQNCVVNIDDLLCFIISFLSETTCLFFI